MKRGNKKLFGRERDQREALLRSLATGLIEHGRIRTTNVRAKAVATYAERLVTRAKKADLASRRLLLESIGAKATHKLVSEIAPAYLNQNGGYTRITKLDRRLSDGAPVVIVEFIKQ